MKKVLGFLSILWPAVVALLIPVYVGFVSIIIFLQSVFGAYLLRTPSRDRRFQEMLDLLGYSGNRLIGYTGSLTDVYTALIPSIWIFVFYFWYRSLLKRDSLLKREGKTSIKLFTFQNLFFLALIAIGCQIVIGGGMEIILPHFKKIMEDYNRLIEQFMYGNAIVVFIATVVLAPFSEELMFRGVIMKKAQKVVPAGAAIVIQSLLFSLFHMNVVQSLYTLPAGLVLGYVAYKFKSIKASIVLHMMFNALSYVMVMPEGMMLLIGYTVFGGVILTSGLWWVSKLEAREQNKKRLVNEG